MFKSFDTKTKKNVNVWVFISLSKTKTWRKNKNYGYEYGYKVYIDKYSFILYIKANDLYTDIAENVKIDFDTSKYKLDKSFPKEKYNKRIRAENYEVIKQLKTSWSHEIMK